MESKFIPTLQAGNGYTYLKLKGILDEDNLLVNLLSQIQGRLLLIDMAEIDRINSCGVRDWVNWLNQIQALGIAVILLKCSPSVVSQANMVTNFACDAFIHSFYAPYVHPDTGDEQSVLLFTEDIRQNQPIKAPKIFNESGEELEFDEFEESYFAFINDPRIMNYQVAPDIQSVIQYFLPEAATRQPVISHRQAPENTFNAQSSHSSYSNSISSGPAQNPYASGMRAQQNPYASGMNAQQNPYASGMNAQQNPYASGMNAQQNPYHSSPRQPAAPVAMPQASQAMQRHTQPPIPSANGYQQAPYPQAARAPMPAPAAPGMPPQASYTTEPKPAPQPISPLAAQSMARQANETFNAAHSSMAMAQQQPNSYAPQGAYQASGKTIKKRQILLISVAAIVGILLLVLIIIFALK